MHKWWKAIEKNGKRQIKAAKAAKKAKTARKVAKVAKEVVASDSDDSGEQEAPMKMQAIRLVLEKMLTRRALTKAASWYIVPCA